MPDKMLGERLTSARKRVGMSQRQLAAAMGERYDQTMISHVEKGRSGFVRDGLSKVAGILGVSIDYLLGLTNDPTPADHLAQSLNVGARAPEIVIVPRVAAKVGSGQGAKNYDETILERLPLPKKWLPEGEISPDDCHLVDHTGNWMEPTLPDGCTILVNLASKNFRDNGIFLLQFEERIMEATVKYLTPVRLLWEPHLIDSPEKRWFIKFDREAVNVGPYGWLLNYFEIKRIIGEVVMVVSFP